ncbi:MAG: hypothetical protein FJ147_19270 [Deltaproteobacteria bacterium]|nr:hypothetical protein [Deltaproteobacteria bacterium]
MKFSELVDHARAFLQERQRVSYRALQREFALDDATLDDLKVELIEALRVAADEDGKVLTWVETGDESEKAVVTSQLSVVSSRPPPTLQTPNSELRTPQSVDTGLRTPDTERSSTERRQPAVRRTSVVGRNRELKLLRERWEQVQKGHGQGALLTGEPGSGASRLAKSLTAQVLQDGGARLEFRCSPYHRNTAFYPIVEYFQRTLRFHPQDSPQERLRKLSEGTTGRKLLSQDALPLLASLLSLPAPPNYPVVPLSAQRKKEKIQETVLTWIKEEIAPAPGCCIWEDLHWIDPSTLDLLTVLLTQVPSLRLLVLLTADNEFTAPWGQRAFLTHVPLHRLERPHAEALVANISKGSILPVEVLQQIVATTAGLPLFVEELTKCVLETGTQQQGAERDVRVRRAVPLLQTLPATLDEVLAQRLARLEPAARELVHIAATLGQEFSSDFIHALVGGHEPSLQQELQHLVEAGLLSERGKPPSSTYAFAHALIQNVAYQSVPKNQRQQYHQRIAEVFQERFPAAVETQPELLAYHYTEAGLTALALPYWQHAGEAAIQCSAYTEATHCFTQGLALLQTLADSPERAQQEVFFHSMLGNILMVTKGVAAPEVGAALTRVRTLSEPLGDPAQLFPVLVALRTHWYTRGEARTALAAAKQLHQIAGQTGDRDFLIHASTVLGISHFMCGTLALAREYCEQALTLYDPQQHRGHALLYGYDSRVLALAFSSLSSWLLGYPEQALQRSQEAVAYARTLSHPHSLICAYTFSSWFHLFRQEEAQAVEYLAETLSLCAEYKVPVFLTLNTIIQGRVLMQQGNPEEGLGKIQEALTIADAIDAHVFRSEVLACQAAVYSTRGQIEDGLPLLTQALEFVEQSGERYYEAELYRLRGELTLQQLKIKNEELKITEAVPPNTQHPVPSTQTEMEQEAEKCFRKALDIARKQQAKSLELRAAISLARLWKSQEKQHAVRATLPEVYNWFASGFETKDLQEAKALLEELED